MFSIWVNYKVLAINNSILVIFHSMLVIIACLKVMEPHKRRPSFRTSKPNKNKKLLFLSMRMMIKGTINWWIWFLTLFRKRQGRWDFSCVFTAWRQTVMLHFCVRLVILRCSVVNCNVCCMVKICHQSSVLEAPLLYDMLLGYSQERLFVVVYYIKHLGFYIVAGNYFNFHLVLNLLSYISSSSPGL